MSYLRFIKNVPASHKNPDTSVLRKIMFGLKFIRTVQTPFVFMDSFKHASKIDNISLEFDDTNSPIFIIGHWRSGTTYLHNVVSQNPKILYPTMHTCLNEDCYISGDNILYNLWRQTYIKAGKTENRGFDNVTQTLDTPCEDEVAIDRCGPFSYYTSGHYFPTLHDQYKGWLTMQTPEYVTAEEIDEWKKYYCKMLKKLLYYNNNIDGRIKKANPRYDYVMVQLFEYVVMMYTPTQYSDWVSRILQIQQGYLYYWNYFQMQSLFIFIEIHWR